MATHWIEQRSRRHPDKVYYYNTATKQSTWEKPTELSKKPPSSVKPEKNTKGVPKSDGTKKVVSKGDGKAWPVNGALALNANHSNNEKNAVATKSVGGGSAVMHTSSGRKLKARSTSEGGGATEMEDGVMEWEERWGEDEEVEMDVDVSAEEVDRCVQSARSSLPLSDSLDVFNLPQEESVISCVDTLFLVLDTNVLISHLQFLMELKDYAIKGVGRPVLVVPWVVMQELDALKTRSRVGVKVRKAISSLNACFSASHPRVRGQTMAEVRTEVDNIGIQNNDDRILHCCLVYQRKVEACNGTVVLFSNDVQLCSKAMINAVTAFDRKTLLTELRSLCRRLFPAASQAAAPSAPPPAVDYASQHRSEPKHSEREIADSLLCEAEGVARVALASAIQRVMVEAYGNDLWKEIVIVKPPWTLKDAIYLIEKHYLAVFNPTLPAHFSATLVARRALHEHSHNREALLPTLRDVTSFVSNVTSLLEVFSEFSDCDGVLPKAIQNLTAIRKKISEAQKGNFALQLQPPRHRTLPSHQPASHTPSPSYPVPGHAFSHSSSFESAATPTLTANTPTLSAYQSMPGLESVGTLAEMQHPILSLASTPVSLVPSLAVDSSLCELFDMLKDSLELIVQGTQQFRLQVVQVFKPPSSPSACEGAAHNLRELCNLLSKVIAALNSLLSLGFSIPRMQDTLSTMENFLQQVVNVSTALNMDGFYSLCTLQPEQTEELLRTALLQYQTLLGDLQLIPSLVNHQC